MLLADRRSWPQSRQSAKLYLQSSELGLPHPQASVPSPTPPSVLGGGAHSLAREGLGESQFRGGDIHFSTLYIYVLCDKGKSADPEITFFKAFGIHVLLKPQAGSKMLRCRTNCRMPRRRCLLFRCSAMQIIANEWNFCQPLFPTNGTEMYSKKSLKCTSSSLME